MIITHITRADGSRLTHIGRLTARYPSQAAAALIRILSAEPPGSRLTISGLTPEDAQLIGMAARLAGRAAGIPITWERSAGTPATLTIRPIEPRGSSAP